MQQIYLFQISLVLQHRHRIVSIITKCAHRNKNNCAPGVKHFTPQNLHALKIRLPVLFNVIHLVSFSSGG